MDYQALGKEIMDAYGALSVEFDRYQRASGLTCLPGCGKCCLGLEVSATPMEMLPLALSIALGEDENDAMVWIQRLRKAIDGSDSPCVIYQSESADGRGHCTRYAHRPLVCRTFGASATYGKNQQKILTTCRPIKEEHGETYRRLLESPSLLSIAPVISEAHLKLASLHPELSRAPMPINQALLAMLEKVCHYLQYYQSEQ